MTVALVFLDVLKMASIPDVRNVALRLRWRRSHPIPPNNEEEFGKENTTKKIGKKLMLKAEHVMNGIWKSIVKKHEFLAKSITKPLKEKKVEEKGKKNGLWTILIKQKFIGYSKQQFTMGKLLDQNFVKIARNLVEHMDITKTIQSLMMSYGYVLHVIFTYIINIKCTVREQARRLRKQMRCSDPLTKAVEISRNEISAILRWLSSNRKWQAGGKARFIYLPPGYNNDPYLIKYQAFADLKSSLIVLKIRTSNVEDNKVQAAERWAA